MVAANTLVREFQSQPFEDNALRNDLRTLFLEGIKLTPEALKLPIEVCFGLGLTAGWWHNLKTKEPIADRPFGDIAALIHSEISEAFEAYRKNRKDDHLPAYDGKIVELADAVIRVFDYVGSSDEMKAAFISAFAEKLEYNANRADHKPENRSKDDGKKL